MKTTTKIKTIETKMDCDEVCFLEKFDQSEDYKKEVKKLKDIKYCRC